MPLTARQQQVLTVMQDSLRRHGYPPSIREVAQRLQVSIGTIQDHLRALERKGVLQRRPFQARGLSLSAAREQVTGGAVQEIPIVGRVTASAPVLVEEAVEGVIPVAIAWATGEDLFFCGCRGRAWSQRCVTAIICSCGGRRPWSMGRSLWPSTRGK